MHRILVVWLGMMFTAAADEATVATFNIRYLTGNDKGDRNWEARKGAVVETIRAMDPDLLGLQEAMWPQIEHLRKELPGYQWAGAGRDDGKRAGEFCAVCWKTDRFRQLQTGTFWLSDTPYTAGSKTWGNQVTRICTWVRLIDKKTGGAFYFFNTHWDHKHQGSREQAARMVAAQIDARQSKGDPVILLGDFNAVEANPAAAYLVGQKVELAGGEGPEQWKNPLVDVFRRLHPDEENRRTVHGWKGTKEGPQKIDHIFVSKEIVPKKCTVVHTRVNGIWPSDHFPVRAVLEMPGP